MSTERNDTHVVVKVFFPP